MLLKLSMVLERGMSVKPEYYRLNLLTRLTVLLGQA